MIRKINKNSLKLLLILTAVFMVFLSVCPMHVSAENTVYYVKAADFKISFKENGDAVVYEKWNVEFVSGNFTRFYKDIYIPYDKVEYFDDIAVLDVKINGQPAEYQYGMDRIDNHYFFEKQSDRYTIHWFRHSSEETVKYEIEYCIKNAVKADDNGRALFVYRLIGTNFPKTVETVKAEIEFPNIKGDMSFSVNHGSITSQKNSAYCEASNIKGLYKISADMPRESFDSLVDINSIVLPERVVPDPPARSKNNSTIDISSDDFSCVFISLAPIALIILISLITRPSKLKLKWKLKKDPDCFRNAASRIEASNIPYEWYCLISKNNTNDIGKYFSQSFYLELFDLIKKGYIEIKETSLKISTDQSYQYDESEMKSYDYDFIQYLYSCFDRSKLKDPNEIPYERFAEDLAFKGYSEIYNLFAIWRSKYKTNMKKTQLYSALSKSGYLRQIKKDLDLWYKYGTYMNFNVDPCDCLGILQRTGTITAYPVLEMLATKISCASSDKCGKELFAMYAGMRNMFSYITLSTIRTSSSDRSSGSSCSSCSSCGGGGAD
ncbi:DUF2207 domain-containing protein [Ruminococcus flavefaciens]|uniref:DUF2207 domain-containing protein n=1 Tax=Ruminococcus flavefaciens TaxID=1265 RepID=UPI0026F0B26B|nr:DUF2207 domain-containing protein [Ruminococcus flavefaciens]MDD7515899.1 DUF2207 domain-containing protein [Ruminococcus flavefaciens]MDY5691780.1 DUF2207 domain-containing protein [Ruminococcus flavefaciens]